LEELAASKEKMQHAHNMTENTHSVSPQDNKENIIWPMALLAGGVVAIIVFCSKSWSSWQGFKEATISCERPAPPTNPYASAHTCHIRDGIDN